MTVDAAPADNSTSAGLSCPYCTADLSPADFVRWPFHPQLAKCECHGCGRNVTVPSLWLAIPAQPTPADR